MADIQSDSKCSKPIRLVVTTVVAMFVAIVAACYVLARESGWTLGRIYVGLFVASFIVNVACVSIWNPVLLARRMHFGAGTKTWDVLWSMVITAVLVALVIVAVRDMNMRSGSPSRLGFTWLVGLCMFTFGWALLTWSMVVNPFFEKTVRIQTDHGHHVIDRGPYAIVRHPGYVGIIAVLLSTPLLIASAWTFLATFIAVVMLVFRTVLEDRILQAELPGYREYAARVRFRLIPGVW